MERAEAVQQRQHRRRRARIAALGITATVAAGLCALRAFDRLMVERAWARIAAHASADAPRFTADLVDGLPEPARRYFLFAIAPGTPLRTVAEIEMVGSLGLGSRDVPAYKPMRAREILAPPHGFVWQASVGSGVLRFAGSDAYVDGEAWVRFSGLGVLPVARPRSTPDLVRSASARSMLEALWVPAALLPGNNVVWEAIDDRCARAVFTHRGNRFALDLRVEENGRPSSVVGQRWSNANPDRVYRFQPFGASVEAVGTFDGFTVPTCISAGNHFGTDAYFPFFRGQVVSVVYR